MLKKLLPLLLLPLLLAACREPETLTQERLDAINCQIGDLPRDQTYNAIAGRELPSNLFVDRNPVFASTLAWNDITSSRQSFSCTIFVFSDIEQAQYVYQRACDELPGPFKFPNYGDLACQADGQEVSIIFQKDVYLVWVWADYQGQGIKEVVQAIDERLIVPVRLP
jgi:hypothetical protein